MQLFPATLSVVFLSLAACTLHPPVAESYAPGLGEIMAQTATRHAKLWFAGQMGNWPLAEYELDELTEGFGDAAKYHPTHKSSPVPLPQLIARTMDAPMRELTAAVKTRDGMAFARQYDALTQACNACHLSSNFGFNVVTRPTHNPFANQSFTPPAG
jgi:cytochrome c1